MNEFHDICDSPELNQISNLNRPTTPSKIELAIKSHSTKNVQTQVDSVQNSTRPSRKR